MLNEKFYPKATADISDRQTPDFAYIRKELVKNGVNKKLLWSEYLEDCRLNNTEPLMYSQFCHYIREDEHKRRANNTAAQFTYQKMGVRPPSGRPGGTTQKETSRPLELSDHLGWLGCVACCISRSLLK